MICVIQRVRSSTVRVDSEIVGKIGKGLCSSISILDNIEQFDCDEFFSSGFEIRY